MIEQSIIDRIIEVSVCEEVIRDFIELNRSGANFVGLSPFTDEKTPSFVVSPTKNIWSCFSSGKKGGAVGFLTEAQKHTFPEAIKYLGKKYNIEVVERKKSSSEIRSTQTRKDIYNVLDFAKGHYYEIAKSNQIALDYFNKRNFTSEIIDKFNLGYSTDKWRDLSDVAIKKGYGNLPLEEADLISGNGRKYWDKFRNRIMFPIQDHRNRYVGFGARIIDGDGPKYLNSKETKVYKKSFVLYGLNHAIEHIVKRDNCYIVEGYTDVISFHMSKVCNTVASCGTSLTSEQLTLIYRYTKNITFIFDGDKAGLKAAYRSIDMALELGFDVSVIKLVDIDPDDLAQRELNLQKYLNENCLDFVDYKASFIKNNSIDSKAKRINNIVASISKIQNTVKKDLYTDKIAEMFKVSKENLKNDMKAVLKTSKRVYKKNLIDDRNSIERLVDLIQNNSELIIEGITLSSFVALRIYELEDADLGSLDLREMELVVKPKGLQSLITEEDALHQLEKIFNTIKKKVITEKLMNITDQDLDSVQHLILVKNSIR